MFLNSISIVKYLDIPERYHRETEEDYNLRVKDYLNIIHKFLIFEKVHKNNFENWTLCPPAKIDEENNILTENLIENEIL